MLIENKRIDNITDISTEENSSYSNCVFNDLYLEDLIFYYIKFSKCTFINCHLDNTNFTNCIFNECDFISNEYKENNWYNNYCNNIKFIGKELSTFVHGNTFSNIEIIQ